MGRPTGRFDEQKELCFKLVSALTKPKCWASNEWLATKLGCSVRQVSRYLLALEKEKRIVRQQYRYLREGHLKTRRHVYIKAKTVWMPALVKQDYVKKKVVPKAKVRFTMSKKPLPPKQPEPKLHSVSMSDPEAYLKSIGFILDEDPRDKFARENPLLFNQIRHQKLRQCAIGISRGENLDAFSYEVQKAIAKIPKE